MSLKTAPSAERSGGKPNQRRPWSLATRLAVWYTASAFLLLLLAMGFLYFTLAGYLQLADDLRLETKIREVEKLLRDRPVDSAALNQAVQLEVVAKSLEPVLVRILRADGQLVAETPGLSANLPVDFHKTGPGGGDSDKAYDLVSPKGRPFRAMSESVYNSAEGTSYRLDVAVDHRYEQQVLAQYRRRLWLVVSLGLLISGVVGYWIAHRGLRPVAQMGATMRRIRSTTLNERVNAAGFPSELSALAGTFNEMMQGLEDAFARLARYSADIAHELRTPINNLRGEAEVALSRGRTLEEYRETLGSCLEECVRLSSLIDSLLFIARAEDPHTQIRRERLYVARELANLMEFYSVPAAEANLTLDLQAEEMLVAELDRNLFQRAVGNLVENALKYSSSGGEVCVRAWNEGGMLKVEVKDSGRGIPAEHLPHVFDRFYRVDATRSKNTGGLGLGLAIVKTISQLHRGTVSIESQVGLGTRITLTFPSAAASVGAATPHLA